MSDASSGGSHAAPAVVELDVPCDWCGHSLRGIGLEGECPECQLAVEHSLRPTRIDFADTRWLGGVRAGVLLVLIQALGTVMLATPVGDLIRPVMGAPAGWWPIALAMLVAE